MALTVQNGSLVVRDGKLGTGQGCCCGGGACQCVNGVYAGKTVTASVTVTLPQVEGDCPGGDVTAEFEMSYSILYGYYWTCHNLEIGQQTFFDYETEQEISYAINGSVIAYMLCDGTQYLSGVAFYTSTCNQQGYNCTFGNGNFIGVGPAEGDLAIHPSVTVDDACIPGAGIGDYTEPSTGVRVQWTITVT